KVDVSHSRASATQPSGKARERCLAARAIARFARRVVGRRALGRRRGDEPLLLQPRDEVRGIDTAEPGDRDSPVSDDDLLAAAGRVDPVLELRAQLADRDLHVPTVQPPQTGVYR